ncbi:hypothetical protein FRC07_010352, partial [Ceratobasidium sp. 392]
NEQKMLAEMLADVEIVSLAGRILLTITEEGNEFADTEGVDLFVYHLTALEQVMNKSIDTVPELFVDSGIQWDKLFCHIP